MTSARINNLAVIHKGRCGSTVLGSLLGQNPMIYWDGEALIPHSVSKRWWRRLQGMKGKSVHDDLKSLMRFAGNRIYGVSIKGLFGFETTEQMLIDLRRAGFTYFVILERRNILRWLVSAEVGTQYKVWHVDSAHARTLRTVHIPLQYSGGVSLHERLQAIDLWYPELRACLDGNEVLNLTYEEHIVPTPEIAYRKVCNFVGVDAKKASWNSDVVNPFPLEKMITNFDEVKEHLGSSKYEWMLNE